jgi:hypothetical protein
MRTNPSGLERAPYFGFYFIALFATVLARKYKGNYGAEQSWRDLPVAHSGKALGKLRATLLWPGRVMSFSGHASRCHDRT